MQLMIMISMQNTQIHIQKECEMALDYCPNGCGERLPRREVSSDH